MAKTNVFKVGRCRACGWVMLLVLAAAVACSPRKMIVNEIGCLVEAGIPVLEQDGDLEMLEEALPAHIKLLETFLASDPHNERILVLLSRLYGSYTFLFVEIGYERRLLLEPSADASASKAAKANLDHYALKGAEYALDALLQRHPDGREMLQKVTSQKIFFDDLSERDVPALFWYGFNLGLYVNANRDSIRAIAKAHVAEMAMLRAAALDPDYNHGAAHLFLLAYYGSRPAMMGGSPAKAGAHYRRLKALAGDDFLLADLFFARYCLPRKQDRRGFTEILGRIYASQDGPAKYRLYNAAARRRAEIYLEAVDRFFE